MYLRRMAHNNEDASHAENYHSGKSALSVTRAIDGFRDLQDDSQDEISADVPVQDLLLTPPLLIPSQEGAATQGSTENESEPEQSAQEESSSKEGGDGGTEEKSAETHNDEPRNP